MLESPDHEPNHFIHRGLQGPKRRHIRSVSQDSNPVSDFKYFTHPVRDVDDCIPSCLSLRMMSNNRSISRRRSPPWAHPSPKPWRSATTPSLSPPFAAAQHPVDALWYGCRYPSPANRRIRRASVWSFARSIVPGMRPGNSLPRKMFCAISR